MTLPNTKRSFFDYVILTCKGFCMGAADVVPGVSGGTMAFILGIYEELLDAIRSFNLKSLRQLLAFRIQAFFESISWKFLLALGLGIFIAIFTLARLIAWLLHNTPVLIWSFFLGLILASVMTVSRRISIWQPLTWFSLITGLIGIYLLVGLVPGTTPDDLWFLFLSGAVAICAMILPGISGSFILVLMGKYQYILEAVNQRDFLVLFIVAAGACAGIASFSRILGWLLRQYHDLMVAFLTGLMLGSLRKIWPWKETVQSMIDSHGNTVPIIEANVLPAQLNGEVFSALGLMAAGFLLVFILDRMVRPTGVSLNRGTRH